MASIIKTESLSKDYGNKRVLDSINLDIASGLPIGLVGPNGAGKTTIMRMISGIYEPTLGKILINGYDTTTNKIKIKRSLGYLAENNHLYNDMVGRYLFIKRHIYL